MRFPPRSWRVDLDHVLAFAGLGIVIAVFYLGSFDVLDGLILALGTLLLYVGSWRLLAGLLRQRKNWALRGELNHFVSLVREIYRHRYRGDAAALHETRSALHESLDRIIRAATTYQEPPRADDAESGTTEPPTDSDSSHPDAETSTARGDEPSMAEAPTQRGQDNMTAESRD